MWHNNVTSRLGLFGVITSLFAVGFVILHIALGPIKAPSPFDEPASALEKNLAMAITNVLRDSDQSEPMTIESTHLDEVVKYLILTLAEVSVLFGAVGLLRTRQWKQGTIAIALAISLFIFYFNAYYCWGTLSCYLR